MLFDTHWCIVIVGPFLKQIQHLVQREITCATPEKQLCVLQFSAHETLYVVVNVGQINMTNSKNEAF